MKRTAAELPGPRGEFLAAVLAWLALLSLPATSRAASCEAVFDRDEPREQLVLTTFSRRSATNGQRDADGFVGVEAEAMRSGLQQHIDELYRDTGIWVDLTECDRPTNRKAVRTQARTYARHYVVLQIWGEIWDDAEQKLDGTVHYSLPPIHQSAEKNLPRKIAQFDASFADGEASGAPIDWGSLLDGHIEPRTFILLGLAETFGRTRTNGREKLVWALYCKALTELARNLESENGLARQGAPPLPEDRVETLGNYLRQKVEEGGDGRTCGTLDPTVYILLYGEDQLALDRKQAYCRARHMVTRATPADDGQEVAAVLEELDDRLRAHGGIDHENDPCPDSG